jgi:hypothetical protein
MRRPKKAFVQTLYQATEIPIVIQLFIFSEACQSVQTTTQFGAQKLARRNVTAFGGHDRTALRSRRASSTFFSERAPPTKDLDLRSGEEHSRSTVESSNLRRLKTVGQFFAKCDYFRELAEATLPQRGDGMRRVLLVVFSSKFDLN